MPAYLIAVNRITDPAEEWSEYKTRTKALLAEYGAVGRLEAGGATVLEGDAAYSEAGIGIIEFADMETLQAFWNSDEYRKIVELRAGRSNILVMGAAGKSLLTDAPDFSEAREQ